jgi:nucleoside-diphosphate-sugar epimerase
MKKILITGASGFIGQSLIKSLLNLKKSIRGTVRSKNQFFSNTEVEYIIVENIDGQTNWKEGLKNIDCIIHCAGRAHILRGKEKNEQKIYQSINVDGSKKLAEQAAKIGVRRLIFLSSIGVNGLSTNNLNFFSNMDMPMPIGNYAFSKYEAEKELMKIAKKTKLEVVIIRPPLVYGKLAPGNIKRIIKIINLGIPLPFGKIKNSRSFIGIDNLIDLLIRCIDHPEASGKIFLASDGEDLSTPELIKLIASSMGRKANLFPFPIFMLKLLGSVFGRREEVNRLIGSLRIDNSYTKETLNWIPPINVEEGIKRMVQEK